MATATKKQTTTPAVAAPKQKKAPKTPVEQLIHERRTEATTARFLFYPGQKGTIIERIAGLIPRGATRLIEPFTGSASVPAALAFRFKEIRCSDAMPAVIAAHNRAITDPKGFCAAIHALFDVPAPEPEKRFYQLRLRYNRKSTPLDEKAAILIYLNRKAAMGLVRHNDEGEFSAPWHESKMSNPPPLARIRDFSKRLKGKATFMLRDFREALNEAGAGDFVYCDPPYLPEGDKKKTFTGYSDKFDVPDHEDLAAFAQLAASRGAKVVISNHDSPAVRQIYASANHFLELDVERKAGRRKGKKAKTTAAEVLAIWNPLRPRKSPTSPLPGPAASLDTPSPHTVMPPYHKTVVKRLRWESAIDPYNRDADLAALDRRVYETAAANGWLKPTATPANIRFRSFMDSGRYLLTVARHGTPAMRRLVLHRPGREHHLSLHLLAKMAKQLRKGLITFGKAESRAQRLLTLADALEPALIKLPNAEKLLVRILKSKAEVVVDGKLDLGELPKRYATALTTLNARGWDPGSEEGHRLLLLAEMTCDADTADFGTLCKALAKGVPANLFVNLVPPEKTGSGKGVPLEDHIARPAGSINKIRDDLKAAMPKPKKPAKKPSKASATP